MSQRGMTLVEVLVSLGLLTLATVAIMPAFMAQLRSNTRNEVRSGAVSAAQETMEALRIEDPATLPGSGSSAPQFVTVGDRRYEVVTSYCARPDYCGASTRHLRVEVYFAGRRVYHAETVYSQIM